MEKEKIEIEISVLPVLGLTLLLTILKLFKVITWPWIWVFSPVWITTGVILLFVFIAIFALSLTNSDDFLSHWGDD